MTAGNGFRARAAIEAVQSDRLRRLVSELVPANRFYAERLASFATVCARGGRRPTALLAEFQATVPFTTKQELVADQRMNPPYGTNLTYPLERYTRYSETSGTTSTPLRWLDTAESWSWMVDNWTRVLRESGVAAGDRIFFAFSFGPFLGFWTAFEAGTRLGCMCLPGGGLNSAARLWAILANRVTVLCCTPTYAARLGEVAAQEELDLAASSVRAVLVAGEPGGSIPATRARIERLWPGARAWDHHGMTETGPVSFECPARAGVLHVMEDAYIPEVINPETFEPVAPGEEGELVLTNLGRTGSPLLRYRTGDLVRTAPESCCACGGVELALEGGILGRSDDMVVVRGVNLFPSAVEGIIRRFAGIAEYRVEIRNSAARAEACVLVEPDAECDDLEALAAEVQSALRTAFNLRIPVAAVRPESLPRFELKAQRWVRVGARPGEAEGSDS